MRQCDFVVDFHPASFARINLPQLRADLGREDARGFSRQFGATAVLHEVPKRGMLRNAATAAGIPAVAFELGGPSSLQIEAVKYGVKAIRTLMHTRGMSEQQ